MTQIEYTNKPSITTLRAALRRAAKAGHTFIQLTWGENQITVERMRWQWGDSWVGHGWIGRNGGSDLADELNKQERAA